MSHHASDGGSWARTRHALGSLRDWHDRRPRADMSTATGWMWAAFVTAQLFWMSNPVVFLSTFYSALVEARAWGLVVLALGLRWLRLPRVPWPWVLFLGLGLLSRFWTINDFHTFVTNTVYLQITALAVFTAANVVPSVVCWSMGAGGAVVVLLSLYAYHLDVPGATNTYYGGVAGVGTNENILAYTIVVGLAATLAIGLPSGWGSRAAWFGLLGVAAVGLYAADSGTGYLAALCVLVACAAMLAWPHLHLGRTFAMSLATGGALALAAGLWAVTTLLDKDLTTFSGRAPFWWATISASLDEAPILGSGWGAVWEHPWDPTPPNPVAAEIYARAGYPLPHGHNFFVDALPELGLVGVLVAVLMVAYAVREVRRNGLRAGASNPMVGRLILLVLVSLLVSGISEPMLTVPLGWWSFVLVVALSRQRVLTGPPAGVAIAPSRRLARAGGDRRAGTARRPVPASSD